MQTESGCSWQHRFKIRNVFCKEEKQTHKNTKEFIRFYLVLVCIKRKSKFFQIFLDQREMPPNIESPGHGTCVPRHGASVNEDLNLSFFFFNSYRNLASELFHLFLLLPIPSDFLFPPPQIGQLFPIDTLSWSISWNFFGLTN